jgi:Tfp pilus assembly protein PilV
MKPGKTEKYWTYPMPGKMKAAEGFTLIEILLAMSILMVGLMAIAVMQVSAIRVNSKAVSITERATLAQDKLEELVLLPYTDPELALTTGGSPHEDTAVPDGFTLTWTVDAGTVANTKEITVSARESGSTLRIFYIKPEF